jgi:P-type E1-E2 ATPase
VLRGGRFVTLPSTVLVPGDVVAVVTGVLPADCVLLTGECIVDENMLTGRVGAEQHSSCCMLQLHRSLLMINSMPQEWPC